MKQIIGSFYFKFTKAGNLIGEYYNIKIKKPKSESANSDTNTETWEGNYKSVWEEEGVIYDLIIEKNTNNGYSLIWAHKSKTVYIGIGFEVDDKLIGAYWSNK